MQPDIVMLYISCNDRPQALEIAHLLVARKLVACANILDHVTSVYRWLNEVQEDHETLLLAKTTSDKALEAAETAKQAHSHETPCITILPVVGGNADYLDWVKNEVS